MTERNIQKQRYQKYREIAKQKVAERCAVSDTANVMMVADGAFVEAVVFVHISEVEGKEPDNARKR